MTVRMSRQSAYVSNPFMVFYMDVKLAGGRYVRARGFPGRSGQNDCYRKK